MESKLDILKKKELSLGDFEKSDESEFHVQCSSECDGVLSHNPAHTKHTEICIKTMKNVIKLTRSNPNVVTTFINFNNWLYYEDILSKIEKKDIHFMYTNLWGYIDSDNYIQETFGCEDLFTKSIDLYQIVKILNFSPNIDSIKMTISEETNNNYNKACNYLKECVELYANIKKETCPKNSRNSFFCKSLEDFKTKYETLNSIFIERHKFPSSLDKNPKFDISCPNIDSETELGTSLSDHPPEDRHGSTRPPADDTGSFPLSYIGFSTIGIIPLFFFLYKFSPIGSFLHEILSGRKHIGHNLNNENMNELLRQTSEFTYKDNGNIRYKLAYQSV
ncbi:PIR Superfamily Protein [Plasmodium ovale curtisi]|uniref:PIR Superfamily Protein n=1 Tax=Plasmodium ovale curtisi TaxID=864141 RepID=A0A1A8X770_PLAOA|nr:PIR Superfamily Protein [Plasmodium ovale curtisi]SBT01092.1 PIR Superfamily Protein [Plasmodium ovale curtisi]